MMLPSRSAGAFTISIILLAVLPVRTRAQEGSWTISAGAGYAHLVLGEVNQDLVNDVQGYNDAGLYLPPFPSASPTTAYTGKLTYRADRDFSWSLSVLTAKRTVSTAWADPYDNLHLVRTIGSTTALLGIGYHLPAGIDGEIYGETQIGFVFAKATAAADWIKTILVKDSTGADHTETVIRDDVRGTWKKMKLAVAVAVGGTLRIAGPFFLQAEAAYRFAQIGKIDGTKTTFGVTSDQTTTINFDYSGYVLTAGIGILFE